MNQFTASLWGDEAWAATLAIKPVLKIIQIVAKDTSPPLYYLFLHFLLKIFGTSEIAIRSFSFVLFLGTVLTVYFIGKHLWDKKTGLLASLLALTNPFLFTYAFEGRMYALLALTSALSIYFFLKKQRVAFIFATAAALYTHHFSIFVVFWELLWAFKEKRNLLPFFTIGLLYLPWVYPLYYQTSLVGSGFWLGKPTLKTFGETIGKFLIGADKGNLQNLALGAIIISLFFRRWGKGKESSIFLLGWFLTPLFLTFLISQIFQSIFFDRYLLVVIPAGCLLIASLGRKFSLGFILLAVFFLAIVNCNYFSHPTKRPFRDLANFVKKEAPNLVLINHNAAAHHLWESKYYGLKAPIWSLQPLPFYTGTALMEKGDVIKELPLEEKIGLISSAPIETIKIPGYHLLRAQLFGELKFLWLEKD